MQVPAPTWFLPLLLPPPPAASPLPGLGQNGLLAAPCLHDTCAHKPSTSVKVRQEQGGKAEGPMTTICLASFGLVPSVSSSVQALAATRCSLSSQYIPMRENEKNRRKSETGTRAGTRAGMLEVRKSVSSSKLLSIHWLGPEKSSSLPPQNLPMSRVRDRQKSGRWQASLKACIGVYKRT